MMAEWYQFIIMRSFNECHQFIHHNFVQHPSGCIEVPVHAFFLILLQNHGPFCWMKGIFKSESEGKQRKLGR